MEKFNSIILSENVKVHLAADVKNSCDELDDMERKVLPTFNSQEEEKYQDFKDMQNDDERRLQQCIDYLQDSFNDILFLLFV